MKLKFKTGDDEVARIMELAYIKRKRAEKKEAEKRKQNPNKYVRTDCGHWIELG